jgi:hypothetical protein
VEAEFHRLRLFQFQKLFLWRCDHVQINFEFRCATRLPVGGGRLTRGLKGANFEETRVSQIVDPPYLQLPEMVLLEFIDFQVLIFKTQHEEILADLVRVEDYRVLK